MGCDIHCYIEYKRKDYDSWSDFGGRINPGRNYWMFGFMAGVRSDFPHITPRGWPEDSAYYSFKDNTIYISEDQEEPTKESYGEWYYSRSHADDQVSKGYCKFVERNGNKHWVTNSNYHSHSWLRPDEFELCIAGYLKASGFQINTPRLPSPQETESELNAGSLVFDDKKYALSSITEYWAILAAMRCLEAQGHEVRLNFWFDN